MAIIRELIFCEDTLQNRTFVSADYCYDRNLFQIRTYKSGDQTRSEGSKQNIQIDRKMAKEIIDKLNQFLNQ